jgi:hypothetical protein
MMEAKVKLAELRRAPELNDYIELLRYLEALERRVWELERRLLNRTDGALH